MGVGVLLLKLAQLDLGGQQALGAFQVAVQEHVHAKAQVGDDARVHVADLGHAGFGELQAVGDLLVDQVVDDALDDVADVLQVDGDRDDVGPAACVAVRRPLNPLRFISVRLRISVSLC